MDKYKTLTTPCHNLTRENFEADTAKKPPYYINGNDDAQYAICPACDNPIQILGLYKPLKGTEKPYAKHYPPSVDGLPTHNQENYDYCPLAADRRYNRDARRRSSNGIPNEILLLVKNEFHAIIAYLKTLIGINISENLARKMLKEFCDKQGYMYTGATLINYPIMIAYVPIALSIYNQFVRKDSDVRVAMEGYLNKDGQIIVDGAYKPILMSFIHHQVNSESESIKQIIFTEEDGKNVIILQKRLEFDVYEYRKYLEYPISERDEKYIAIAKELIK